MTRTSRTSFITIVFAAAGFAMFSQGASARTAHTQYSAASEARTLKYCARLENRDSTGCREARIRMKRHINELVKVSDGNSGHGGKGGRGK